jgi:TonB-linked SusC/RagA family outer membrane protein
MKKFVLLLVFTVLLGMQSIFAQKQITGKITSAVDGSALPGVTVSAKGTTTATYSDVNGKYTLSVPTSATTLVFSFIGMKTQEVEIGNLSVIDAKLESNATNLEGVVVTALGITREKKSLGYSTQEVKGDMVSNVATDNVTNALSGKVAGVQVTKTTNIGGSTNIVLRGNKSLTGDNQVLFVIDGVPVNNEVTNTVAQKQGGAAGFDYGNAASDINPDDIESINVLKGAAATALYGSRAANGVIMITTKKGSGKTGAKKGIGVTLNSSVTEGFIDKSTFPTYQKDYGAGYDPYWNTNTFNGVAETWAPTTDDASYGYHFNPSLMIYQWDAVDPSSPNYQKATPWIAAKNGPITFFKHPFTFNNTVAIENALDKGSYRFSYTNFDQKGLMPNSELKKNNFLLNGTWKVTDKLTATGSANYITENTTGRNSTGYNDNICTSFRQWDETNVDMKEQWNAYNSTKRNDTWNWYDPTNPGAGPAYWDNYYWTRYENYESDSRNRFIGNMSMDYKLANWVDIFGRISGDSYNSLQEERRAVGSIGTSFGVGSGADGSSSQSNMSSGYLRRDITFSEYNYDLMANFNKDISKNFSLKGILGTNIRRTNYGMAVASTGGGLIIPELYALQNSAGPLPLPKEAAEKVGVNGIYASASLGFKNYLYLDVTARQDHSSTLPPKNSTYYYPSVSGSFVFTNLMPESDWLSFGKVRLNWASVGNSASFNQLIDNYNIVTSFNTPMTSVETTKKDSLLKPEKTNSLEAGLEMYFFKRRLGFDLAVYKTNTTNQILPLAVSSSTGYYYKNVNAGEIQNKGIELTLNGTPINGKNFKWNITVNWAMNRNMVVSLLPGVENMQLQSFQGGVTIDAHVGQPYGVIEGTDYTYYYDASGKPHKIIDANTGMPVPTATSDQILGNMTPKWTGGITNTFTYKNWALSFLVDVQDGGDIFSLDMYYGLYDGLYPETDYTNDLGNPVRDPLTYTSTGDYASNSGGYVEDGVNIDASGHVTQNKTRVDASTNDPKTGFGFNIEPNKGFVYSATYIKLREVTLSYTLPANILKKCFITGATLSLVAANPWIIYKKLPYADPESGLGAGNVQGYSVGSLPSTRDFGVDLKLSF